MKIVVAGSRTFEDYSFVKAYIEEGLKILKIKPSSFVSGVAKGVDHLGEKYAKAHYYPVTRFHADWEKNGKAAGPIRNMEMAKFADAAIILNEQKSRGASNMASCMKKVGKPCIVFHFRDYKEVDRELNGDYIGKRDTLVEYVHPADPVWKDWNKVRD